MLVSFIWFTSSHGQTVTKTYGEADVEITKTSRKKFSAKVEIKSFFPGGDSSWLRSPETALNQSAQPGREQKGKYLVSVRFIVGKSENISDLEALTNNGYGMKAEVCYVLLRKSKVAAFSRGDTGKVLLHITVITAGEQLANMQAGSA